MKRKPDECYTKVYNGISMTVSEWCDPTDLPWDGDCELEPGSEGWDIYVEARIDIPGHSSVMGRDSLGSIWILPDRAGRSYIEGEMCEVASNACSEAYGNLLDISNGKAILEESLRMVAARELLK